MLNSEQWQDSQVETKLVAQVAAWDLHQNQHQQHLQPALPQLLQTLIKQQQHLHQQRQQPHQNHQHPLQFHLKLLKNLKKSTA
jgi:hypothetical protein